MSIDTDRAKLNVDELAARFRSVAIPLTSKFSYFSTIPIAEEDLRQYLNEPVAAISPAILEILPKVGLILAPYVEKANGKTGDMVSFERPPESRYLPFARRDVDNLAVIVISIKDMETADYHYELYSALAGIVAERLAVAGAGRLRPNDSRGVEFRSPRRGRREELAPQAGAATPPD